MRPGSGDAPAVRRHAIIDAPCAASTQPHLPRRRHRRLQDRRDLATGGSSTTFRATSRTLAREVALKFVHPVVFAGETRRSRPRAPMRRASRASSTRASRRSSRPACTRAGCTSRARCRRAARSPSSAPRGRSRRRHGAGAARRRGGARAAHEQGVVHRDVRPESITVDRWGHGVVRDFGVTRTSGRTGLLTRAEILDSLRFTAPELVLGRAATPATDVYGLAAVAVWCLTGAPPYRDRPAAEYVLFRASAAPPVLHLADGGPAAEINAVLAAAMALEPAERPGRAVRGGAPEAVAGLPAPAREAGSPLMASEAGRRPRPAAARRAPGSPSPPPQTGPAAERADAGRAPAPGAARARDDAEPAPWGTYAACAMVAVTVGLGGLLVGRAGRRARGADPERRVRGRHRRHMGRGRHRRPPRSSSARASRGVRARPRPSASSPRAPARRSVPAERLPDAGEAPAGEQRRHPARDLRAPGTIVVARPTSRGTIVAMCTGSRPPGAARRSSSTRRAGPRAAGPRGRAVSRAARGDEGDRAGDRHRVGGIQGDAPAQAGAARRLASALREAASGLQIKGVDRGTAGELERLRAALTERRARSRSSAARSIASPTSRSTPRATRRAGRRKLRQALAAFGRAGYPVQR